MFSLQNAPFERSSLAGLDWEPLSVDALLGNLPAPSNDPLAKSAAAKFDLSLDIRETESGLLGRWEYRPDLFSAKTIHRLAGHFRTLLKALPEGLRLRLSALPMLSRHEAQQLQQWQQPPAAQPLLRETVHRLFEAQAAATPEAIALIAQQTEITYQTLNQHANQLAHWLRQQGISLETPVGIWAVRSPKIIVAILAILKAGGTYVPLDPHYPLERLTWMVRDTQMALLIADAPDLPIPSGLQALVQTVDLSAIASQICALPTTNFAVSTVDLADSAVPESLAYILYTSGSTGRPKGVCTTHQGITHLVKSPNYVTLTASEVLLQAAPLTFDAATFEIWGALLNGGKLVLLSAQLPSLQELAQAIVSHQITTLWLTAGLFNLMVDEQLNALQSVRQLIAGGDVLSVGHLRRAFKTLKNTRIINGYGPTEATTFTCCYTVTQAEVDAAPSVPIGYPLAHTQIYVLDTNLQPVPAGIPGELYIGGAGVARGYLNRPDLTAERFIPNPFGRIGQPFSTLYKTGDHVRHRADGALEYLGRLDQQIKVRGFRIELGEIEAALTHHPDIQQAAVIVSGDRADQKRLVAYLAISQAEPTAQLSSSQAPLQPLTLRQFLLEKLPDYMVPTQFVWLSALPLTTNGKIDRRALPACQQLSQKLSESAGEDSGLSSSSTAPKTETEQALLEIFSALLPVQSIGIHDNFFELGGDSIIAMQIVSRAAQSGLTISLKQLFQYQTIAELASVAQQGSYTVLSQTAISQALATGEVLLTPIQRWFFKQSLAVPEHFNQAVCLTLPKGSSREALTAAIAHIYQHHDALRLRFTPLPSGEQGWQQQFSDSTTAPAITWFDLSHLSAVMQDLAIAQQTQTQQASLNIQTGPLVSVCGFDLGAARESQLFIAIHHLIIDGVSWRILLADLQQAYRQALSGKAVQLPPKTHSYQQWAQELMRLANSAEIEADRDYWQAIAKAAPINIPQDISQDDPQDNRKGKNNIENAQRIVTSLPADLTQSLLQKVPSVYNTQITEALLTALAQTIAQWTNHSQVLFDLESHGRFSESLDLSRTVGWFTTLYPMPLKFEATRSLADNFKGIKAQMRAVPHQGLSYGLLRYLKDKAEASQALALTLPISFNYLGQIDLGQIDLGQTDPGQTNLNQTETLSQAAFNRVETLSANQAAANVRPYLIDINCWIASEQLQVEWTFSRCYHTAQTINSLAEQFLLNLSALIEHCCAQEVADYSPDDFSLVALNQLDLEAVFSQVSFAGEQEAKR
jgi:amino acid adenylation domain-containing protein/non-ribosomal peptide synthase protein (TIGR01720 family)